MEQPILTLPKNKCGRPKGSKDRKPRYRSRMAIVPKTINDLARKEIAGLAPEGSQIDMIGTLRAALAAIVGVMVRELGHDSDRSILR